MVKYYSFGSIVKNDGDIVSKRIRVVVGLLRGLNPDPSPIKDYLMRCTHLCTDPESVGAFLLPC